MNNQTKSIILIDGSNFYFKLKDLGLKDLLNFNFTDFANFLYRKDKFISGTYYIGAVKTDGTERTLSLYKNQRKLLVSLRKHRFVTHLVIFLNPMAVSMRKGLMLTLPLTFW